MSRLISLLMALLFIGTVYWEAGLGQAARLGPGTVLVLALIWYGDEMGEFTGLTPRGYVTARSPGWLLRGLGWIALTLATVASILRMVAAFRTSG